MQELTNEIYWATKPQQVRDLANISVLDLGARSAAAQVLDSQGFVIDEQIDLWGWDPLQVMVSRFKLGYPWVPNAFQPPLANPLGLGLSPKTDFTKPWPRSIKVSVDAADYPAVTVGLPTPVVKPVGAQNGNLYSANIEAVQAHGQWFYKDGDIVAQDGHQFQFHILYGMFGASIWFTLVS